MDDDSEFAWAEIQPSRQNLGDSSEANNRSNRIATVCSDIPGLRQNDGNPFGSVHSSGPLSDFTNIENNPFNSDRNLPQSNINNMERAPFGSVRINIPEKSVKVDPAQVNPVVSNLQASMVKNINEAPFGSVRSNIPANPNSGIQNVNFTAPNRQGYDRSIRTLPVDAPQNFNVNAVIKENKADSVTVQQEPKATGSEGEPWVKIYSSIPRKVAPIYSTLVVSGEVFAPKSVQIEENNGSKAVSSSKRASYSISTKNNNKKNKKKKKKIRSVRFKDRHGNKFLDTIMEIDADSDSEDDNGTINRSFQNNCRSREGSNRSSSSNDSGIAEDNDNVFTNTTGREVRNRFGNNAGGRRFSRDFDRLSTGSIGTYSSDTLQTGSDATSISTAHLWSKQQTAHMETLSIKSLRSLDWGASPLRQKKTHGVFPLLQIRLEGVPPTRIAQAFTRLYREQLLKEEADQLDGYAKWKHNRAQSWKKSKQRFNEWMSGVEIWRGSFKTVEGHFGSSVLAYFRFIKWLFFMNLFTTIMILCFIIIPQELVPPGHFNGTVADSGNVSEYVTEAVSCSARYEANLDTTIQGENPAFHIINFFLGKGWMENTALFAGYYFNKTLFGGDNKAGIYYNLPLAYLLTSAAYFLVILILMVNYTGKGVREKLVNSGDRFYRCCNKVFCGWDYSLSTEKAAKLKHRNLCAEYKHDIYDAKRESERRDMGDCRKVGLFLVRLLVWLVVLAIWAGSFYLIVLVVGTWTPELISRENVKSSWILTLIVQFLPSLTLTGLNVIVPPIFEKIVIFEDYNPETEVRITIARTVILRLASVGVLSFSLHNQITDCDNKTCGNCPNITCWESYVGQEFYKLVILDFIVIVAVTFFLEFPRKFVVKKFETNFVMSKVGYQEFEIPKNVIELVYSQTICWLGGFFSPIIPAITVLKFFIFFYVKKLTLLCNCIPATRSYRASKSNYFFMIILMMSYGLCLIVISYAVGRIPPSQSCAPWRVYTLNVTLTDYFMYHVVTQAVDTLPSSVETILEILSNWVIYVILLIILCLIIYYYQAISSGNKRRVELLKEQLALEGMDKQFLLRQVNDVLQRGELANKG